MNIPTDETYAFATSRVYFTGYDGKFRGEIRVHLNLCNLRECLAKSILLTVYKPKRALLHIEVELSDSLNKGRYDKETMELIDDCQTLFSKYTSVIPVAGIFEVGHIKVMTFNYLHTDRYVQQTLDDLEFPKEIKEMFKDCLEKAATIVEGMYQFTTSGKFTDKCLKLIEEYHALQILKG